MIIQTNTSKSTGVIFSLSYYCPPKQCTFDNENIPWQPSVKYLGLTLYKQLPISSIFHPNCNKYTSAFL